MQRIILFILLVFTGLPAMAQFTIKGTVTDTLNYRSLPYASVVVFRAADSVIASHVRANADGKFSCVLHDAGKYLIRVSFPGFAEYIDNITVSKPVTDFGTVPMVSKEHLLKEFVITQQIAAIKIKGDTTEYMADSFKVKDNATVEDLLKRLPGIQVDKNGQITAQGEVVQKILVDGEEFFADDPKVVTQGLQANAVQKVQVFDKKSEQAEFTGIDDGQKTKTINLELKDDKKKGYFGKVDAGGGTDGYYQNQAMINDFKAKQQISAFGIISNTDKVGLGWADNNKYSSGNGTTEINDDGTMTTEYSSNSDQDLGGWDGTYNGQGVPQTWTGGVHYANKWDDDKEHLTANYRYALQDLQITGNTLNQYVLPGNAGFTQNQQKNQFSQGNRNGLDFMYEKKIDTNTSVKLTVNGGTKVMQTNSVYNSTTLSSGDALQNTNLRNITSNSNGDFVNADLVLKKKFKKKGRTLSLDFKENYKLNQSDGTLKSNSSFPRDTTKFATDSVANINQLKSSNTYNQAFEGKATYTEPLSKVAYLELNYGVTVHNNSMKNNSFDSSGKILDSLYSSNYKYNILTNIGGASMKFVYKNVNFSFGGNVAVADWRQTNQMRNDSLYQRTYTNFYPMAVFNYKFAKSTNLYITYNGTSQQPSISQITPLLQNTDPLNITIGNPNLKQEFINTFGLRYNDFKMLSQRFIWSNFTFSTISNSISTNQFTQNGVNTTQYINVNGNYTGSGYAGYGFRLKKLDLDLGMQGNYSLSHIKNVVNDINNVSNNNSYGGGPYINYNKQDKYDFSLQSSVDYNDNRSSISAYSTSYWSSSSNVSGTIQLPKKFEVNSSVDVLLRQKTPLFDKNNNVVKWNAFIGKKFLKKSQLELKVSVLDILNQNIGYSRMSQNGIVTENTYNTVKRYGMLNLVWNFTHNPAAAPQAPAGGGIMIKN